MTIDRAALRQMCATGTAKEATDALRVFLDANRNSAGFEFCWREGRVAAERVKMSQVRITVLSSFTAELLEPYIGSFLLLRGIQARFQFVGYDRWREVLLEKSEVDDFAPNIVLSLLHIEYELPLLANRHIAKEEHLDGETDFFLSTLSQAIDAFQARSSATIVVNTVVQMERGLEQYFDWNVDNSRQRRINNINESLAKLSAASKNTYLYDYSGLVTDFGRRQFYDRRGDLTARASIAHGARIALGEDLARFLSLFKIPRKKALVIDLDNTVWGGVVGEDGADGIAVAGEYPGNAHRSLQDFLANLRATGVLLAIASKNNEKDVLEAFERRKDDLGVGLSDFASAKINWGPKSENILDVARDLNIIEDSLVFADDSPVECAEVRAHLPAVSTIHLSGPPAAFTSAIIRSGVFDAVNLTSDDAIRAEFFEAESSRKALSIGNADQGAYLKQLEMKLVVAEPSDRELDRVVQLMAKTNQFNLTTRRYDMQDMLSILSNDQHELFTLKLTDRFGSYGTIGVVLLRHDGEQCVIDSFLMSCRALGRKVEDAALTEAAKRAATRGADRLVGLFIATPKNDLVKDFYRKHGFSEDSAGRFIYQIDDPAAWRAPAYLEVVRSEEAKD